VSGLSLGGVKRVPRPKGEGEGKSNRVRGVEAVIRVDLCPISPQDLYFIISYPHPMLRLLPRHRAPPLSSTGRSPLVHTRSHPALAPGSLTRSYVRK